MEFIMTAMLVISIFIEGYKLFHPNKLNIYYEVLRKFSTLSKQTEEMMKVPGLGMLFFMFILEWIIYLPLLIGLLCMGSPYRYIGLVILLLGFIALFKPKVSYKWRMVWSLIDQVICCSLLVIALLVLCGFVPVALLGVIL